MSLFEQGQILTSSVTPARWTFYAGSQSGGFVLAFYFGVDKLGAYLNLGFWRWSVHIGRLAARPAVPLGRITEIREGTTVTIDKESA